MVFGAARGDSKGPHDRYTARSRRKVRTKAVSHQHNKRSTYRACDLISKPRRRSEAFFVTPGPQWRLSEGREGRRVAKAVLGGDGKYGVAKR